MAKFSEIFRKLDPSEYNNYPFMLAVKKEDEDCFYPIYKNRKSQFVDRAFITISGGLSQAPENPAAPLRRPDPSGETVYHSQDSYIYTVPFIRPVARRDETYEYWVLKGEPSVSLRLFSAATKSINCALEYTESEEGSVEVWQTDLDSILCDVQPDDPQEAVGFIKNAEAFLTFLLADKTTYEDLKEILCALFNAAVDLKEAMEEIEGSYYANYDFDTNEPGDDNKRTYLTINNLIYFGIDSWNETFALLGKISNFDFGKQFAYCDIAGRQDHIAALGDILSQRSNCLFYLKWKELFTWYSNRMQAASFNMVIRDIESQIQNGKFPEWNDFLSLCAFDMSQTTDNYSFLVENTNNNCWVWKSYSLQSCQDTKCNFYNGACLCSEHRQTLKDPGYKTPRWDKDTSFCYDTQVPIILTNVFFVYSTKKKEIIDLFKIRFSGPSSPAQNNKTAKEKIKTIREETLKDLDFNFSIIARAIRVFCENVLLALYKIGRVPGQTTYCTDSSGTRKYCHFPKPPPPFYYYMGIKDQDRIESSAIRTVDRNGKIIQATANAYKDPDHQLSCQQDIVDLFEIANPEMHATGDTPDFDKYEEILDKIKAISKEVLYLLKKKAAQNNQTT